MTTETNPFKAPEARLEDDFPETGNFLPAGRQVPAGHGINWLGQGWRLFRQAPGTWIGLSIVFFIIMLVLGMIPIINFFLYVLMPVFIGGIMIGCKAQDEGGDLSVGHLFAGFSSHTGNLILVGVIYLVGVVALIAVAALAGGGIVGTFMALGSAPTGGALAAMLLPMLLFMLLLIPLAMAVWYAPALVIFHQVPPFQAMKTSFFVCLKNFVPFLVYGLATFVLAIVAAIPLGLGLLVLGPVIQASVYASYRDMFTNN